MPLTKRCFILEDDPERIAHFRELFANTAELTIVDSCAQAEQFQPPYDVVFLDHDLGGRQLAHCTQCKRWAFVAKDGTVHHGLDGQIDHVIDTDHVAVLDVAHEDCGARFVELIHDKLDASDIVIVHSYNRDGAERMLGLVPVECASTYAPFRGNVFNSIVAMLFDAWQSGETITVKRKAKG